MATRITSGPAEVLDCGQVTAFNGRELSLHWIDDDDPRFHAVVAFTFGEDPELEDAAVQSRKLESGWHLHCVNFDAYPGRGSSVPVLIGGAGDDAIYLHFRVFKFGRTEDRTVHYTFYRLPGAIVDDGEDE